MNETGGAAHTNVKRSTSMNPTDEAMHGLSSYDAEREARRLIEDDSITSIPMRVFNKDIQCPVCWGIIRDTRTIMRCLHRFCRSCIERALAVGKKECPTCRIKVPSHRSLRADPMFDQLVAKIYPDIDAMEQKQMTIIKRINEEHIQSRHIDKTAEVGLQRQAATRSTRITQNDIKRAESEELRRKHKAHIRAKKAAIAAKRKTLEAARALARKRGLPVDSSDEDESSEYDHLPPPPKRYKKEKKTKVKVKERRKPGPKVGSKNRPRLPHQQLLPSPPAPVLVPPPVLKSLQSHTTECWINVVADPSMKGREIPYDQSYLRMPGVILIRQLTTYIANQLKLKRSDREDLELRITLDSLTIPLHPEMTIISVIQHYWTRQQDLVVTYGLADKMPVCVRGPDDSEDDLSGD